MAKKSKGFGEILLQQQWANASERSFDNLKQKVNRSYGKDIKLVMNQGEIVKMSEVLEDFLSPYTDIANNKQGLQVLFSMGMLAWNIALMPAEIRSKMLEQAFATLGQGQDPQNIAAGKDLVEELIERKQEFFAHNQRRIISFELQYVAHGDYHISVASTMPASGSS
jgi:hypothetical protein